MDRTSVSMFALKANLGPSLDLLADIIERPTFAPPEIERLRGADPSPASPPENAQPSGVARRTLPPLLFGGTRIPMACHCRGAAPKKE